MRIRRTLAAALILLAAAVEAETLTPGALAGNYYLGDGLGLNLSLVLLPGGAFSYTWRGCLGVYAQASGRYSLHGRKLALEVQGGDKEMMTRFEVVTWDGRIYLVPEGRMLAFVNEVNQKREPRTDAQGSFYLRQDDWDRAVSGAPDLPPESWDALLARSVEGRVLRRGKDLAYTIDLGARDGLRPGLELTLYDENLEYRFCQVTVTRADDDSSVVQGEPACRGARVGASVCSDPSECKLWDDF